MSPMLQLLTLAFISPGDASVVQITGAVFTALVVVIGAGISLGMLREQAKNLEDAMRINREDHTRLWSVISDHGERLGYVEGKVNGRVP